MLFVQTGFTLLVNLYKTISIKYNFKQNINLSSLAHGFLNIITAQMVNALKPQRPLPAVKSSQQVSTMSENPLDESSDNSEGPTNTPNLSPGIISPPPFYTKCPKRIPKMTSFKLFPKCMSSVNHPTNNDNTINNNSTLPH